MRQPLTCDGRGLNNRRRSEKGRNVPRSGDGRVQVAQRDLRGLGFLAVGRPGGGEGAAALAAGGLGRLVEAGVEAEVEVVRGRGHCGLGEEEVVVLSVECQRVQAAVHDHCR